MSERVNRENIPSWSIGRESRLCRERPVSDNSVCTLCQLGSGFPVLVFWEGSYLYYQPPCSHSPISPQARLVALSPVGCRLPDLHDGHSCTFLSYAAAALSLLLPASSPSSSSMESLPWGVPPSLCSGGLSDPPSTCLREDAAFDALGHLLS